MYENEEIASLLAQLKRAFRSAGFNYADIAKTLGVSEPTVKRWMMGRGLTLTDMARLCDAAGLTIGELVDGARDAQSALPPISHAQAKELSSDIVLGTVFFLLSRRWRVQRIQTELALDPAMLDGVLARLDRIGVIHFFPGNRVRLLRRMAGDVREHASMFELVAQRVHEFFDSPDLSDPDFIWTSGIARLSPASCAKVADKLNQFRNEIFALGEADLELPPEHVTWHMLFFSARPIAVRNMLYPCQEPPEN